MFMYAVRCNWCHKKTNYASSEVVHRLDKYSSDCAVSELVHVDRFYVVCKTKKCSCHINVAKIVSPDTKKEAKERT